MSSVPTAPQAAALLQTAAQIAGDGQNPIGWDTPLSGAGFDSLARLELAVRIEQDLGVPVPDSVLVDVRTLRDLLPVLERP